jgi:lipopolysaccharide export LptBFGC system permease protein LptF
MGSIGRYIFRTSFGAFLLVMNAAGMPPGRLFRPFLAVGLIVSILVGAIAAYLWPKRMAARLANLAGQTQ